MGKEIADGFLQVERIEREAATERGRIDIVVETNECIIGIENKIWAAVNNDFSDYQQTLENRANEREIRFIGILLSLKAIEPTKDSDFENVTYDNFFKILLRDIGLRAVDGHQKYVNYLFDFIHTIQNLTRNQMIDKEFLNFARENKDAIGSLLQRLADSRQGIKEKVSQLRESVSAKLESEKPKYQNVTMRSVFQAQDPGIIEAALLTTITLDWHGNETRITVDTVLNLKGWEIRIYLNCASDLKKKLSLLLQESGISLQRGADKEEIVSLPFDAKITEVEKTIHDVVDKIAGASIS